MPAQAELNFLDRVKWLDMYGVDLHPVLGEDHIEYYIGLTPAGIIVLKNKTKVGNYFWPRIGKVYYKGCFFMLQVKDKGVSISKSAENSLHVYTQTWSVIYPLRVFTFALSSYLTAERWSDLFDIDRSLRAIYSSKSFSRRNAFA